MERSTGLLLIMLGVGVALLGLLVWTGALGWFGRLPGDIRIETERTRVFLPITSMVVVSVAATIVANLVARWLR
ncbi:MAG: DUF2905 domain-containing protein [Nitriliruptoraceae bacterium]